MRKLASMAGLTAVLRESDSKRAPTRGTGSFFPTPLLRKPRGTVRAVAACATPIEQTRLAPPSDRGRDRTVAGAAIADPRPMKPRVIPRAGLVRDQPKDSRSGGPQLRRSAGCQEETLAEARP